MTTWCVRNDVFDSELVDEGFISLGWDDVGDLRQYGDSQDAIREGLQRTLPDAAPGALIPRQSSRCRHDRLRREGRHCGAVARGPE